MIWNLSPSAFHIYQNPRLSFTRMTWILSLCLEKRVMRNWQQIVSGDLQFMHEPVLEQGVLRPKRCALMGAATFLALLRALSTSAHTLFIPTIKTTFLGP